jgi:hypothetical protein
VDAFPAAKLTDALGSVLSLRPLGGCFRVSRIRVDALVLGLMLPPMAVT